MKSNSRRSSKKKSIKKEKVSINDKIITQENKLRNISLLDTLEMQVNQNKADIDSETNEIELLNHH